MAWALSPGPVCCAWVGWGQHPLGKPTEEPRTRLGAVLGEWEQRGGCGWGERAGKGLTAPRPPDAASWDGLFPSCFGLEE